MAITHGWLAVLRLIAAVILGILAPLAPAAGPARPASSAVALPAGTVGADISWPQCPKGLGIPQRRTEGKPLPGNAARFVVLGLTNGPGLTRNPCLADQVLWARQRGLPTTAYAVVTCPSRHQLRRAGTPGAFGERQAAFLVRELRSVGLDPGMVFLDVEPYPLFPCGDDLVANADVVTGAVAGLRRAGQRVGVYSTTALWPQVVGDLRLGLPEWRTAGPRGHAEAVRRCDAADAFQGGPAVLSQWWSIDRLHDVLCRDTTRVFTRPAQ